jgi:NADPH-dependent ferric siderophore reductase
MAEKKSGRVTHLRVLRTEWVTPHMIRVVGGGAGLAEFQPNAFTDAYVKLQFPVPGVAYPEPFDLARVRAELPRDQWPRMRTYTVRSYDELAGELTIDFVYHGDEGLAGPWAAAAKPGDVLMFGGPGGAYAPNADADWHLLAGDEAALPAIGAALEAMPAGAVAHVFVEVADAGEEQALPSKADVRITWLHRAVGDDLVGAVRGLDFPTGDVHAFVHGEADAVRALRRYLLDERGVPKDRLSISGYWRRGKDEDGWQAEKAEERASKA